MIFPCNTLLPFDFMLEVKFDFEIIGSVGLSSVEIKKVTCICMKR